MEITDILIARNRINDAIAQMPDAGGFNEILNELEPYAATLAPQIMGNPEDNQPFVTAVTAMSKDAIQRDPDKARQLEAKNIEQTATRLRLLAIEATLKGIREGEITLPTQEAVKKPVIKPNPLKPEALFTGKWKG